MKELVKGGATLSGLPESVSGCDCVYWAVTQTVEELPVRMFHDAPVRFIPGPVETTAEIKLRGWGAEGIARLAALASLARDGMNGDGSYFVRFCEVSVGPADVAELRIEAVLFGKAFPTSAPAEFEQIEQTLAPAAFLTDGGSL